MSLTYTIKAMNSDDSYWCHPCAGAYSVFEENGQLRIRDCNSDVYFTTEDHPVIYVMNADGKTIDVLHRKLLPAGVSGGVR